MFDPWRIQAGLRSTTEGLIHQMHEIRLSYEDYVTTTKPRVEQMAADMDDYLIPGIGLRFDLLSKTSADLNKNVSDELNNHPELKPSRDFRESAKISYSGRTNDCKLSEAFDEPKSSCQQGNQPEIIESQNNVRTCIAGKSRGKARIDSTAWSVDTVTIKSGKHRTNRHSRLNKERKTVLELLNPVTLNNEISQVANQTRSSHYVKAPPSHHPYCSDLANINSGRRSNGPYRLKSFANDNFVNKDSTLCADSSIKSTTVNKQMANVGVGISTDSPARVDRWEGGLHSRGILKQTTVLNGPPRGSVAPLDRKIMDKKTMMKRQCMYFPVDDYVTLSRFSECKKNTDLERTRREISHEVFRNRFSSETFEKQLSPITISSGYESDYSPPWPMEMEKAFSRNISDLMNKESANNQNHDDSHTDYFSQSETYPRSKIDCEKNLSCPDKIAPGCSNQLTVNGSDERTNEVEEFDGYDNLARSRRVSEEGEVLTFTKENSHDSVNNRNHRRTSMLCAESQLERTKIYFEKYLLGHNKRDSTVSLGFNTDSSKKDVKNIEKAASDSVLHVGVDRYCDTDQDGSVKSDNNVVRRSKRYRLSDAHRESLCKPKTSPTLIFTEKLDNQSDSIIIKSTSSSPSGFTETISPVRDAKSHAANDRVGRSPALGVASKLMNRHFSNSELDDIKTNVCHEQNKCVGETVDDKTWPVTRNMYKAGCVTSPRGKHDSDYEHIYDVIPGDENAFSPIKFRSALAFSRSQMRACGIRSKIMEDPPALPARSYMKSTNDNSAPTSNHIECSSADGLYAKVNIIRKHDTTKTGSFISTSKPDQRLPNSWNKENDVLSSMKTCYSTGDYDYLSSETYCRIGSGMEEEATNWSSGDVLNFIDGIEQPEAKRRENIYSLLNNRQTRAKLAESLEIENKLVSMGLLKSTWSKQNNDSNLTTSDEDEVPPKIPPREPLRTIQPIFV